MDMVLPQGHGKMPNNKDTMIVLIISTFVVLYFSCYIGV
jgi:hypothetical protein